VVIFLAEALNDALADKRNINHCASGDTVEQTKRPLCHTHSQSHINTETNETTKRQHIDQTEKNAEKMLFLQKNTVIFIYITIYLGADNIDLHEQ
jgi:hypothetical protein